MEVDFSRKLIQGKETGEDLSCTAGDGGSPQSPLLVLCDQQLHTRLLCLAPSPDLNTAVTKQTPD